MYDNRSNLIIGFHGCDKAAASALINNPDNIKISKEPHDWLGHGMYFWENNQERAKQWAPIYDGAEIYEKTHIQICIRNSNCIKGFFLPRQEMEFLPAA